MSSSFIVTIRCLHHSLSHTIFIHRHNSLSSSLLLFIRYSFVILTIHHALSSFDVIRHISCHRSWIFHCRQGIFHRHLCLRASFTAIFAGHHSVTIIIHSHYPQLVQFFFLCWISEQIDCPKTSTIGSFLLHLKLIFRTGDDFVFQVIWDLWSWDTDLFGKQKLHWSCCRWSVHEGSLRMRPVHSVLSEWQSLFCSQRLHHSGHQWGLRIFSSRRRLSRIHNPVRSVLDGSNIFFNTLCSRSQLNATFVCVILETSSIDSIYLAIWLHTVANAPQVFM